MAINPEEGEVVDGRVAKIFERAVRGGMTREEAKRREERQKMTPEGRKAYLIDLAKRVWPLGETSEANRLPQDVIEGPRQVLIEGRSVLLYPADEPVKR